MATPKGSSGGAVTGAGGTARSPDTAVEAAATAARFRVLQGLAGHVPLPPCGEGGFEALVAEVLGHLASSEGYVAILHQVGFLLVVMVVVGCCWGVMVGGRVGLGVIVGGVVGWGGRVLYIFQTRAIRPDT